MFSKHSLSVLLLNQNFVFFFLNQIVTKKPYLFCILYGRTAKTSAGYNYNEMGLFVKEVSLKLPQNCICKN